jgi:DNA-binding SARP family transcriptional activator/TolB-like protein
MIRITTLGALDLRSSEGASVQSVLRQPKRFAILAYLAIARPRGFHRRDRLLALFWPELDRDRARHALSQAVFYLRQSLGRDVVVGRGDEEIGLAPDGTWCDVVAFEEALERDELEAALGLYAGELLSGFHISEAIEFERWREVEQERLAQRAGEAAWTLAERMAAAGAGAAAASWAKRAVSLAPWEEAGLRRLIALLDSQGDRAGAVAAYQDFARRLQLDLETEPAAETRDLIEAVKRRADAGTTSDPAALEVVVPVSVDDSSLRRTSLPATVARPRPVAAVQESGAVRRRRRERWAVGAIAVVAVAGIALAETFLGWPGDGAVPSIEAPIRRLAVLPFVDQSPGRQNEYIADALTTELIAQLHDAGRIDVVSRSGAQRYRGERPAPKDVGRDLNVGLIVAGTVLGSDEAIRVHIELVDAATALTIAEQDIDALKGESLALVRRVVDELEIFLRPVVGKEFRLREWKAGTASNPAWEALKKADATLTRAEEHEREGDLNAALRSLHRADVQADDARELDREWNDPVLMQGKLAERRAVLSLAIDPGNMEHRRECLLRGDSLASLAIEMDANDAAAWEFRGTVRNLRFLLAPPAGARADTLLDAAAADLRQALLLDEDRPRAESSLSAVLLSQGDYEAGKAAAWRAYRADAFLSDIDEIVNRLFTFTFNLSEDVEAGQWCDEVRRRMPDRWPQAHCEMFIHGWSTEGSDDPRNALFLLANFGDKEPAPVRAWWRPRLAMLASAALVRAGQTDSARALIERTRASSVYDDSDPVLLEFEAAARVKLGDESGARALLHALVRIQPTARRRLSRARFFEPLFRDGAAWLER